MSRRVITTVAALIGSLWITVGAAAQGTSGTLPGPINSRQLTQYGDRLGLSVQQRQVFQTLHDQYRLEFKALREGEMAVFLREQQAMSGGLPEREKIDALFKLRDRIDDHVGRLDNRLFDRLMAVLSDEQQAGLPRVRLARERDRYDILLSTASFGQGTADLSDIVIDLGLDRESFQSADAVLLTYERRLTRLMRKRNEAVSRMTLDLVDSLAERGFRNVTQEELLADPEQLQIVLAEIQAIYGELNAATAKLAHEMREFNRAAYRRLAGGLSEGDARRLRAAFFRGSYAELAAIIPIAEQNWMIEAEAMETPTVDERAALRQLGLRYDRDVDRLLEQGADLADGFWASFSPFDADRSAVSEYREKLLALMADGRTISEEATRELDDTYGAESIAVWRKEAVRWRTPQAVADAEPEPAAPDGPDDDLVVSGDRFLPARMTRRDVSEHASRLDVDTALEPVLLQLHADYVERFGAIEPIARLRDTMRLSIEATLASETERRAELVGQLEPLRRESVAAIRQVDGSYFDAIADLLGDEQRAAVERLRNRRLRRIYAGSVDAAFSFGRHRSEEAAVDVGRIVDGLDLTPDVLATLDAALLAYESGAVDAFRNRYEAQLALQTMSDRWAIDIQVASDENLLEAVEIQEEYRQRMQPSIGRVDATNRALVEVNRRTRDDVAAQLSEPAASEFRRGYDRAAFPTVFDDAAAVDRHLTRALEVSDLNASQRGALDDLAIDYRTEYARLTDEMIAIVRDTPTTHIAGLGNDDLMDWQERHQRLGQIAYDRNELNGRAINLIRLTLTERQLPRVGRLPEPLGEDDVIFYR